MDRQPGLARRFFDRFEPVHAVTYFAPEARAALDGLGYRGFWMGYFAARSAPFGVVPTEVVAAAFYNFASYRVAKALPAAWEIASPADALRAREQSAVAALRRYGVGDDDDLATAADLAAKAARNAALDGRPLFAANLALDWPEEPVAKLWHAVTLLREHRGDGHVAVLSSLGISGREMQRPARGGGAGAQGVHHAQPRLRRRAMELPPRPTDPAGSARRARKNSPPAGRELKQHIEDTTDALALGALDALDDDEVETLFRSAHTHHPQGGGRR